MDPSHRRLSLGIKEGRKFCVGDKARGLAKNSSAGSCVKLKVVGDGQRLAPATWADAAQFDMTSAL